MEEIKHFSHEHPLSFFQDKEVDDYEDQKPYFCRICGLPILSSPSYTCSINANCNFFLHKPCARMPETLDHPVHHDTLHLKPESPPAGDSNTHGGKYVCSNKFCDFKLHPLVAVPVEIKSKHRSHKSHQLVANGRETLCLCDACGEEHKGFFFSCQECNFWIHQDCALLPSVVKLPSHSHPFLLTYSLPRGEPLGRDEKKCVICRGSRGVFYNGVYFCGQCNFFAHLSCAKSNMENLESQTRLDLIQLPADDEWDTFPSFVIRRILERFNPISHHKKLTIDHHKHPLMFHEGISSSSSSREACTLVCDLCIKPINISSPFYKCLQPNCHFIVHNICANLPSKGQVNTETKSIFAAYFYPKSSKIFFSSTFSCYYCRRPCNGSCYRTITENFIYFVDLECACAPNSIKHTSHGQHVLFRTTSPPKRDTGCCSADYDYTYYAIYQCISCKFYVHLRCALLPKRTRHEFDEHPLELITTTHNFDNQYCEFCEEDIDCKYWFYRCGKCEQSFHIKCIPSVGYFSKVKFGKTLVDDNIHHHPITLTRMLTVGRNETCGYCKKIIQGFVDEMAFHCSECDFRIHFSCARDSSCAAPKTSTRLRIYSESTLPNW